MKKILLTSALATTVMASSASAAIINVADLTGQTGGSGYVVDRDLGVTISGDSAVYMLGTMTFPDITALNGAYTEATLGLGTNFNAGYGNGFGGNTIVIARNGTRATATSTFSSGVPVQLLIKFDQTSGASTLWVNPNLGMTEALNTPEASVVVPEVNGASFDSLIFRGGDFTQPIRSVDYNDFAVYFGGDTPFSTGVVIPEPASLGLLGFGGMMLLMRRRRA